MGIISKQDFCIIGIDNSCASKNLRYKMGTCGEIRQEKIAEIAAAVLMYLCWGVRGE